LAASYAQLGRDEEAKKALAEMVTLPGGRIEAMRWRLEQWSDRTAREHLAEGLRKAGFAEP
jgi:predicted Zn-dependent protease